jgi:hypothetical protein
MTKAELLKLLEPFPDDALIVVHSFLGDKCDECDTIHEANTVNVVKLPGDESSPGYRLGTSGTETIKAVYLQSYASEE